MKCSKCKLEKPETDFPRNKNSKTGRHLWCKVCKNTDAKERHRYVYLDPDSLAKYREYNRNVQRRRRQENPIREKRRTRNSQLLRDYGITLEDYELLSIRQDHLCAICGIPEASLSRSLSVDHCHTTGKIRGLLCDSCNTAIGSMGDSPARLRVAAKYLEEASVR